MIPIRLRLMNFLSYGEDVDPLDFTPFRVACLSGRNGHGKSALLDAMTWAIWGEARKASYSRTPDADLLRINAEHMEVEFSFYLDNVEYQVFRDYHSRRRTSRLEFRAMKEDGSSTLLTGSSKRETQKRIIETIGLDYRTFISSSFLQQGKADEFTRQPPRERKEILCNILGLDYYDRLQEETRQRLAIIRAEHRTLESVLENIAKELAEEPEIKDQEAQLTGEIREKEKALKALRAEEKILNEQIAELNLIRDRIQRWREEQNQLHQLQMESRAREEKLTEEQNTLEQLLMQEEAIRERHQRYEEVGEKLKELLHVDRQYVQLDTRRQKVKELIEGKRARLRETLATLRSEHQQLEQVVKECNLLLQQREEIEANYAQFKALSEQLEALQNRRPEYERIRGELESQQERITQEEKQLSVAVAEMRGQISCLEDLRREVMKIQKAASRITPLELEMEKLRQEFERFVETAQQNTQQMKLSEQELEQAKKTQQEIQKKLAILQQNESAECPLCRQPIDQHSRGEILKQFKEETRQSERRQKELNRTIVECKSRREQYLKQHDFLKEQLKAKEKELAEARQCGVTLTEKEKEIQKLETLKIELQRKQAVLSEGGFAQREREQVQMLQEQLRQTGYAPEAENRLVKEWQTQRKHEAVWEKLLEAMQRQKECEEKILGLNRRIQAEEETLQKELFAVEENRQIQELLEQLAPLEKSLKTREALQLEQQELRNAPTEWNQVQYARGRVPDIKTEKESILRQRQQNQIRLEEVVQQIQQSIPRLDKLEEFTIQRAEKEQKRRQQEEERDEIQRKLGGIQEKLNSINRRKAEQKQSLEKRVELQRDERLYEILKDAFSRNGIPAMIVEQSLPELEADANRLLHQLTDGRYSIAIESQRQTRSGGMSETLDIKISDEIGTRNYEMYSGGEAFRTDLSLRIALSQLLCRRAGRRLQLLVIDEGFGTQDSEGLNNIVDAISEIQDEFEKVLVVTHLEELKDKFGTRIEVYKEPGIGSRFEVVHVM